MTAAIDFSNWTRATGDLDWGVQRVMHDTIALVAEGKINLVWGADYRANKPCLVNAVAQMISASQVSPMGWFPAVVGAFDNVNAALSDAGVNTDGFVSPLAAEVLLANFGELKPIPTDEDYLTAAAAELATCDAVYVEPSDKEMQEAMDAMVNVPSAIDGTVGVHAQF